MIRCKKGKNLTLRTKKMGGSEYFCRNCGRVVSTETPYFKYDESKCGGCTKSETDYHALAVIREMERREVAKHKSKGSGNYSDTYLSKRGLFGI